MEENKVKVLKNPISVKNNTKINIFSVYGSVVYHLHDCFPHHLQIKNVSQIFELWEVQGRENENVKTNLTLSKKIKSVY